MLCFLNAVFLSVAFVLLSAHEHALLARLEIESICQISVDLVIVHLRDVECQVDCVAQLHVLLFVVL